MSRKATALIAIGALIVSACAFFVGMRVGAHRKLVALLDGKALSIRSATVEARGKTIRFSSEAARLLLAQSLREATREGTGNFTVAESTTLRLRFGVLQEKCVSLYITTDGRLIVSVPPSAWDGLVSFSDHDLWQLDGRKPSENPLIGVIDIVRDPSSTGLVEWRPD